MNISLVVGYIGIMLTIVGSFCIHYGFGIFVIGCWFLKACNDNNI